MRTELVDSAGSKWQAKLVLGCALTAFTPVVGCGNAIYAFQSNSATAKLEAARELGAEQYAAYNYYMAVEHLQKAQEEAADADYSDAIRFAEVCEEHAEKATQLSRDARRRAGR
jgi:hypothetical protein